MIRTGIDSYCYHRNFGIVYPDQVPAQTPMSVEEFLQEADRLGADGVSLHASFLKRLEEPYLRELAGQLEGFGLEAVYAWTGSGNLEGLTGGVSEEAFTQLMHDIPMAKLMGAKTISITGAGMRARETRETDVLLKRLADGFKKAAEVAENYGITLALENQMVFTPLELLHLVEQVASDRFGISFDTGNFIRQLTDPLEALNLLAKKTKVVYLKPVALNPVEAGITDWYFFSGVPAGQGLSNDQAVFDLLERAGYKGLVLYSMDHPQTDWYDREKEAAFISARCLKSMARHAER